MTAYYNEIDPFAAAWLRELVKAGHIAPGEVDERSIVDVAPTDLLGFTQCHFFAGIGVWSYALRCAGWPDDRPVWTGSCPCQPFSVAGKGKGTADERHLWPEFARLIGECRPATVFGEQVAAKAGRAWLNDVRLDLEALGYGVGAADLCAAGFGAPHIRQRLYWVGHTVQPGLEGHAGHGDNRAGRKKQDGPVAETGTPCGQSMSRSMFGEAERHRQACGLADPESTRREIRHSSDIGATDAQINAPANTDDSTVNGQQRLATKHPGPTNGHWRNADWLFCRDGKWRAVEPGTFPLAHRAAARVGRLRCYGNAIVVQQATAFIEAFVKHEEAA